MLGVEPSADSETIQHAYQRLAQQLHPNTPVTGDKAKFEALNLAFEVLSDPELRASFDRVKGVDRETGSPKFSGAAFFRALEHGSTLRLSMLCVLYDRRRMKPTRPVLSLKQLEGMVEATPDEIAFSLWYLKQRGLVMTDDKSAMEITVEGMDYLEGNQPPADAVMKIIKREALADAPKVEKQAEAKTGDVLNALSRALHRGATPDEAQRKVQVRTK